MSDIYTALSAFKNLLDFEYEFVLGRKNKTVTLIVEFQKLHFFHIAGLQHLKDLPRLAVSTDKVFDMLEAGTLSVNYIESSIYYDLISDRVDYLPCLEQIFDSNDTIFKYNPSLQAFSVIEADFLMKNVIKQVNVFTFLSKDKNGKYFCRSFFPDMKKDYSENQTNWTVLLKKKICKSTGVVNELYRHRNYHKM